MCVARLCTDVYALDTVQWRDKHRRETNKVTEDTKSESHTVQSLTSLSHDDSHAIT